MGNLSAIAPKAVTTTISLLLLLLLLNGFRADARIPVRKNAKPYSAGSIGNFVWLDKDKDGRQDAGEPGFSGVTVVLNDINGAILATTVTDTAGKYLFSGLNTDPSGKVYEVLFKLPAGYRFAPKAGVISDPAMNSDADELSGKTGLFTLMPGQTNTDIDAGLISSINGTLPLHTLELTATLRDTKVNLKWVAENEMNTKQFFIQRSFDGINFTDIGNKVVAGQINTPTQYVYVNDIQNLMLYNVVYYRVKAEDNIQRFAYSNVALLRLSKITGIRVWPNPVGDFANITYNSAVNTILDVNVLNSLGIVVKQNKYNVSHGLNQLTVNGLETLSSGIYFIRINDYNNNQVYIQKISK